MVPVMLSHQCCQDRNFILVNTFLKIAADTNCGGVGAVRWGAAEGLEQSGDVMRAQTGSLWRLCAGGMEAGQEGKPRVG